MILISVLILAALFYIGCSMWSRKLVVDYWQWRFRESPPFGPRDFTHWFGLLSLVGAFMFRLENLGRDRFPPL